MRRIGTIFGRRAGIPALAAALLLGGAGSASARVVGVESQTFALTTSSGKVTTSDGSGLFFWGYDNTNDTIPVQYPGPTMIVVEDTPVTVTLTNQLDTPVSIVFPGQDVTATGGTPGLLTREALPGGTEVTYTFTPAEPGTYLYHSGTDPALQVEMGLVGALIVRPAGEPAAGIAGCDPADPARLMRTAYGDCRTAYDYEFLFLLTEMSPKVHEMVELGLRNQVKTTDSMAFSWFINGRGAPDTLSPDLAGWLPNQPYSCLPLATPGDRVLQRVIGAGRDQHPLHAHGNNFDIIARDGRLLSTLPAPQPLPIPPDPFPASRRAEIGVVPDLSLSSFTVSTLPGATYDSIFAWTGKELGWDFFGHNLVAAADILAAAADPSELHVRTTLDNDLGGGITVTVPAGVGALMPSTHAFRAVLSAAGDDLTTAATGREVVMLTASGPDTFTAVRAAEGSAEGNWSTGDNLTMTDHGAPFPVVLPDNKDLTFGQFYSGSPFLGSAGVLPPGEGGFNPNAGFAFMWHSHTEKELTNNNVFPGGLMTFFIVLPPGTLVE